MTYLSFGGIFGYLSYYHFKLISKIVNRYSVFIFITVVILVILMFMSVNNYFGFPLIVLISFIIGIIITHQSFTNKFELRKVPFLERIGKYTYGLYLYHVICNFIINTVFIDLFNIEDTIFLSIIVKPFSSLILSFLLSYYSYHYFESFFLKLKTKFRTV